MKLKSKVLTWKFWNIVTKFYDLFEKDEKICGTIPQIISRINSATPENAEDPIKLSDGFFYSTVLPVLIKHKVLIFTGERYKRGYRGKFANIYEINFDNLDRFIVLNNNTLRKIYEKWVKEGKIEIDILSNSIF